MFLNPKAPWWLQALSLLLVTLILLGIFTENANAIWLELGVGLVFIGVFAYAKATGRIGGKDR